MTSGSSSRLRWTCVSPEYQPRPAMSVQRFRRNVSSTGSRPTVTVRDSGRYSLPRSTVMVYWPGGRSSRNGWADSVVCISTDFGPRCLRYSTAEPSFASERAKCQAPSARSEEHTSELQSRPHLVCRLLLEKKKKKTKSKQEEKKKKKEKK